MKPVKTEQYELVNIGDVVEDLRSTTRGVVVRTPGFYHATVLWEDGDLSVVSRLAVRKAILSRNERAWAHYGSGTAGVLKG